LLSATVLKAFFMTTREELGASETGADKLAPGQFLIASFSALTWIEESFTSTPEIPKVRAPYFSHSSSTGFVAFSDGATKPDS
jgi:hypothetical protein